MGIEMLRDQILVQVFPRQEQTTEAGLVIPVAFNRATATPGPPGPLSPGVDTRHYVAEAVVVAAGPGRFAYGAFEPTDVKRGDRVLLHTGGATAITIEARECLMVRAEALLAVLERSNPPAPTGEGGAS